VPTAEEWAVVAFTLRVAALGTALMLPVGVGVAALLARSRGPGRTALETVFSLPLVLPPTAAIPNRPMSVVDEHHITPAAPRATAGE